MEPDVQTPSTPAAEIHPVVVTDANFQEEVLDFPGVTLVDFWATWCGPCRQIAPHVLSLAVKYADNPHVKIAKMDVDANQATSQRYQIRSIPSLFVYKGGEVVEKTIGLQTADSLEPLIVKHLPDAGAAKTPAVIELPESSAPAPKLTDW